MRDVEFKETDLRIDTFENIASSAVKVTHIPTGLVSECKVYTSSYRNKIAAIDSLAKRIEQLPEIEIPEKQEFKYFLHDHSEEDERREMMEDQGIVLSEEAWENIGRPFYEVTLNCSVDRDGNVTLESAKL
jgi:protein subunit release factor B